MFYKIGVLKIFYFFKKTPVPETLFNEVTGLYPAVLLKEKTPIQVFSGEFCKIHKTPFLQNTFKASVLQKNISQNSKELFGKKNGNSLKEKQRHTLKKP